MANDIVRGGRMDTFCPSYVRRMRIDVADAYV